MTRRHPWLNSLRSRLILLVVLAIAPTALMTVVNGLREREHAIEVAEENLQRLTNLAAANEAQSIERARQILRDVASVPDLLAGQSRCNALLGAILKQNPDYANFGLIQMNGDISCSAVQSATPVNLRDRPHFQRAIKERRFIAGNYVFGRVIRKHTINLTYPVIDKQDEVVAVLFAALELSELDRFANDVILPPGSLLLTADSDGKIISHRPNPDNWFGRQITPEMTAAMAARQGHPVLLVGTDGIERMHSFARVGQHAVSDYTITIGIPSADIVAAASHDQMLDLVGLAVTIAIALAAAWFVGDVLVVRRVNSLVATADRIATGSLDARTGMVYGNEEISRLARSLDAMAEALQKKEEKHLSAERQLRLADQRKDEFLAMLAHELRNPLAPISAGAQLLARGLSDPAGVERTAAIITRQVGHMTRLVDDLLDVSRVTRGLVTLAHAPLDVAEIVDGALEQVAPLLQAKRHQIEVHPPAGAARVLGDHKRLVQVLANLLNNAAKYTPEGGHIALRVERGAREIELIVSDDGVGMAPELVARVFELFAQAERSSDRSLGGLGLGLALARSLVELHGGRITAESGGENRGSTFRVFLPLEPGTQSGAPASVPVNENALRVLVVDDNFDAAQALQACLQAAGHEVMVAHCARDGIALAAEHAPQVCLLDIGLPDLNGMALARELRALPAGAAVTLVAVSGYGRSADREQALAAGFDHYLVKPFDLAALRALVDQLSQRS
ncbi:MAG: ATP-binding protein [Pseudomonadota bacterium]